MIISGPPLGKKLLDGTALNSTFSGSLDSSPFESFTLERKIWTSQGSREIDWGFWGPMLWTKSENGWQTVHPFNICLCIPPSIGKHLTYLTLSLHCHYPSRHQKFPTETAQSPEKGRDCHCQGVFLRLDAQVTICPCKSSTKTSCFIMFHHCHSMSLLHIIAKSIPTMTKCSRFFPQ